MEFKSCQEGKFNCPECDTEYDNLEDANHCCDWMFDDISQYVDEYYN